MAPRRPVTLGNHTFSTQKAALEYVRSLLHQIGYCNSVKESAPTLYTDLWDVLERHPSSTTKLHDVVDLRVSANALNTKAYEVYVVKPNGVLTDISWHHCVTGLEKTETQELLSALRYSIADQIHSFQMSSNMHQCTLCNKPTNGNSHIDHVNHFAQLVHNFQKLATHPTPVSFDDALDGTNRRCFRVVDAAYERAWLSYHGQHAQLRVVCQKCNLTRKKCIVVA